jgi:hypothetical protein
MPMANIRSIDMLLIDDLFQPASFFAEEFNINIDDAAYAKNGTSKLRRLKCFLQTVDRATAIRSLKALWEYRELIRQRAGQQEKVANAQGQFLQLIARLESTATTCPNL